MHACMHACYASSSPTVTRRRRNKNGSRDWHAEEGTREQAKPKPNQPLLGPVLASTSNHKWRDTQRVCSARVGQGENDTMDILLTWTVKHSARA